MDMLTPSAVLVRYRRAKDRREIWENHWQECYDYALPQRDGAISTSMPGERKTDRLFDGTAPDGVDQLAASLLAQLTPPWARWFGLAPGVAVPDEDQVEIGKRLDDAARVLQSHFDRSNFAVEIHQCYLDLVTCGTATLLFEEAPAGEPTAFRFTAVPLGQVAFEEDASGRLVTTFRRSELTRTQFKERFPHSALPDGIKTENTGSDERRVGVVEMVTPHNGKFAYVAVLDSGDSIGAAGAGEPLIQGTFHQPPFINFRWLKAPGEIFGRSPVMKALPDIKTANKVVELVLKNASIAVTGIWQAEDDGVLNPATIKLTPGTIIPKAVGSNGLTPLSAPGSFDVSQIVLDDLRARIRHALLADKLGQVNSPQMTATEVLERAAEMSRVLGATYGRLQSELLTPLVMRGMAILGRRGEIPTIRVDGQIIDLEYKSPLARRQAQEDVQTTLLWLEHLKGLGGDAESIVDPQKTALWLARAFGVPRELIKEPSPFDARLPSTDGEGVDSPDAALADTLATINPSEIEAAAENIAASLPDETRAELAEVIGGAPSPPANQTDGQGSIL